MGEFNPAFNQRTYQSSTYGVVYKSNSSRAVDSNKGTDYERDTCSHTDFGVYTWWAVDLDQVYTVYSVTVTNRNHLECPGLLYGQNCSERCSVSCRNGCRKDSGQCTDGCLPGFIGDKCQTECPDGTYGVKCETTCSSTCTNPICDKYSLTGTCLSSCKPGYMGDNCTVLCPVERYGAGCSSECHCSSATCNHITGVCDTGCAEGWLGETCNKQDKTVKNIDTENKPGGIIGPAVGGTVGVLVALAAVVLVGVICYRRGLSKGQGGKEDVNAVALENNRIYMNKEAGAMADNADYTNLAVTDNRTSVNVEIGETGDPQYTVLTPQDSTYQVIPDMNGSTHQNKEQ